MFYRVRQKANRIWFNFNCRRVLHTPPLPSANCDSTITLASMLCHADLSMYLLAVKSLVRQLNRRPAIVILNDGSLTQSDIIILSEHLPAVTIVPITSIAQGICPKGGAWELLLMIAELVQNSYVIQVDSDTLTLGPIPEIMECVYRKRNFALLGDRSFPRVESMHDACARAKTNNHPHVQALCERSFDLLPESKDLRYLRGNAGFIGFAKGSIDRRNVEWFSDLMRRIAMEKWNEWGSEQVTTNLLIANSDDPMPLPSPRYVTYWAHQDIPYEDAAFIHFVGPHRYSNGFYIRNAKKVLQTLL